MFQLTTNLGYALALFPIFFFIILNLHEKGYLIPSLRLEFVVETHFLMIGIITVIWVITTF
jgi:hypothetical protein